MTGPQFADWLNAMKAKGLIKTDGEAADLLGFRRQYIYVAKKRGVDKVVDLACAALYYGLAPFNSGL